MAYTYEAGDIVVSGRDSMRQYDCVLLSRNVITSLNNQSAEVSVCLNSPLIVLWRLGYLDNYEERCLNSVVVQTVFKTPNTRQIN